MPKVSAKYTNGKTSEVLTVFPKLYKQGIVFFADNALSDQIDRWQYGDIKVNHDWTEGIGGSFEHKEREGATLAVADHDFFNGLKNKLRNSDRATYLISTRFTTLVAVGFVAVAVVIFGFPLISKSTEKFAYIVPQSIENKIGDIAVSAIDDEFAPCRDVEAEKNIQAIVDRLLVNHENKSITPKLHLYKTSMVNAFALPAQHMAVLSGFLKSADSEEEIAGVLAHEIGHIANKDPLKYIMQQQGLQVVSSLASSGSGAYGGVAQMATTLSSLDYSRDKEFAADEFAADLLGEAGYTTDGLIRFLLRAEANTPAMLKPIEENLSFLSTHPTTSERIARLKAKGRAEKSTREGVLNQAQMKRLQTACAARSPRQINKN